MEPAIEHFKLALDSGEPRARSREIELWFEIGNALELLGNAQRGARLVREGRRAEPSVPRRGRAHRTARHREDADQEVDEFDEMFDNMISKD